MQSRTSVWIAFACLAVAESMDSDLLRALAYTGFLLNLINLAPIGILDGGHVLRSWRVLHAGAGAPSAVQARWRANAVAIASVLTAVALVAGMVLAHVPQDRL